MLAIHSADDLPPGHREKLIADPAECAHDAPKAARKPGQETARPLFIADHIPKGQDQGALAHEIGAHYGIDRMLTRSGYQRLLDDLCDLKNDKQLSGLQVANCSRPVHRVAAAGVIVLAQSISRNDNQCH